MLLLQLLDRCIKWPTTNAYRVVQKRHKVKDTIILQPYVTESFRFQQNASKEILYMTKVII